MDLTGVAGSGPGGRIVEKGVLLHVEKRKLAVAALRGRSSTGRRIETASAAIAAPRRAGMNHWCPAPNARNCGG